MALEYLLSPEFQISTTSGKPDTGGWIEVYLSGTRTKYFTSCDFNGTKNPFRVPLDSLGQAMMLADSGSSYDCYFYNRYGTLLFSRMNVTPSGGGAISSVTITSSDDSLTVTPTENGVDLSVNGYEASVLRAVGAAMTTDGRVSFTRVQKTGTAVDVSEQNKVMASSGWFHYDIVGRLTLTEATSNQTERVTFTTNNDTSVVDFDMTYAHTEAVHLSGEWLAENETTEFYVDVSGIPTGMTVSVEDLGIHAINGVVDGHAYSGGRNIDITNKVISFVPTRAWRSMHGSTWCDCGDVFGFLVDDAYYDPDNLITVEKGTNEDSEHNITHWGNIHIAAGHAAIVVTSVTLLRKPDELQPTLNSIAFWYGGNPVSIYGARHEFLYDNSQSNEIVPQIVGYFPATENGTTISLGCSAGTPWYYFKPTELWVAVLD